ncbi:PE family protein [Mycobacterium asiaticum]|uniref:PE family protein n=1 Tax=Mycobacterium asiaticum TaxID=1790 RepID=A0A1A3N477_MYCAS|nr:PE family protein [Mycobacterium asiaticum]OBK15854.1 PE family protein [Mycobacterium asiaticum]
MDSMSHNPAAGDIGSQLVDIGSQGISAGSTAAMSVLSGLIPAGGEEVSAQAVMAFAQEAATMLASNAAAQEELMRTGSTLTDISRMYSESDDSAANALLFSANPMSRLGSASASNGAAGLGAAALQSELAASASNPLVAGAAQAPSSSVVSAGANAGSSAMSGAAPLGSGMGAGTSAGGASKPSLASATGPADDQDDGQREDQDRPFGLL